LFDAIIEEFNLKSDAGLSQFLDVPAPQISRIRHRRYNVSGDMILRIYDKTDWSIEKIRNHVVDPK
jgi:plasmid maintenance system antidote protein VapI